jgi:type VI secretion system protein ImpA
MARLTTLAQLGATNATCTLAQLQGSGRSLTDLGADLDTMVAKALPDPATQAALDEARGAAEAIAAIFADRYGAGRDPQLGFELILGKLQSVEAKLGKGTAVAPASPTPVLPIAAVPGIIASRDDVVRALDRVLDYYRAHEPSSPVPLLVQRAKRLVPLSFLDAMRELAPAGLKELQAVAGTAEEKK